MTDRPIIFSAPMVRALLDGRKTQTRRLATSPLRHCAPGDRLWVRESVYFWSSGHDGEVTFAADGATRQTGPNTGEIPDLALAGYFLMVDRSVEKRGRISRPSIHMPRWASRLTLFVEDVRVELLNSITNEDALAEGLTEYPGGPLAPSKFGVDALPVEARRLNPGNAFAQLWQSLHTADGQRWEDNPDVLALTFRVERGNIDRLAA